MINNSIFVFSPGWRKIATRLHGVRRIHWAFNSAMTDVDDRGRSVRVVDFAQPNNAWSPESRHLFGKLQALEDFRALEAKCNVNCPPTETRFMARCDYEQTGRFFNYAMFVNEAKRQLLGVAQFGSYTEATELGHVHGGAISVLCDAILFAVAEDTGVVHGSDGLTANMQISYERFLDIDATYLLEGSVDNIDGRKVFTSCRIFSPDRQVLHVKGTSLLLNPKTFKIPAHPAGFCSRNSKL